MAGKKYPRHVILAHFNSLYTPTATCLDKRVRELNRSDGHSVINPLKQKAIVLAESRLSRAQLTKYGTRALKKDFF